MQGRNSERQQVSSYNLTSCFSGQRCRDRGSAQLRGLLTELGQAPAAGLAWSEGHADQAAPHKLSAALDGLWTPHEGGRVGASALRSSMRLAAQAEGVLPLRATCRHG